MSAKPTRIIFNVTPQQHEEIRQAAKRLNLSISEYLRALHEGANRAKDSLELRERYIRISDKPRQELSMPEPPEVGVTSD